MNSSICGCQGNRDTSGCKYTIDGRTMSEAECSGSGSTNINELESAWQRNNCPTVYSNILFNNERYNSDEIRRIQADTDNVLTKYIDFGFQFTDKISSPKFNPFQDDLINMCNDENLPGACDLFLNNYCEQFARKEIEEDLGLTKMCGCYSFPDSREQYPVPAKCDPLCHLHGNVQKANSCNGQFEVCSNQVCIIDDTVISLFESNISDETIFQQICQGCGPTNPCTCIIGGQDIVKTIEDSGVGVRYEQFCGQNAQCFLIRDGRLDRVTCPGPRDFGNNRVGDIFWVFVIVITLFLMFASFSLYFGNNKK